MKTPEQIADDLLTALDLGDVPEGAPKTDADMSNTFRSGWMEGAQVRDWLIQAVTADRAQRADDIDLPEPWSTTLRVIEGDGEEYTDTVRLTFTRDWDDRLTQTHTVTWETFVKALAVVAREEAKA